IVFLRRLGSALMAINQHAIGGAMSAFHDFANIVWRRSAQGTVPRSIYVNEDGNRTKLCFDFADFSLDTVEVCHALLGGFRKIGKENTVEETLVFLDERRIDLRIVATRDESEIGVDVVRFVED